VHMPSKKTPIMRAARMRQPSAGAAGKPDRPPTEYYARVYKVTSASGRAWPMCACVRNQQRNRLDPPLLQLCKLIPKGKVSTYGEMAKALGSSARAVGQVGRPCLPSTGLWLRQGLQQHYALLVQCRAEQGSAGQCRAGQSGGTSTQAPCSSTLHSNTIGCFASHNIV
jgi:6-O-methylguanine DNA methyltransferase, DNA binding domain